MASPVYSAEQNGLPLSEEVSDLYPYIRANPDSVLQRITILFDDYYCTAEPVVQAAMSEIKGDCFYTTSKYDSALYYLLQARVIYKQLQDSAALAINSVYAAEVCIETGVHESAALHLFTAQRYFKAQEDTSGLIDVHYALSILYYDRSEYEVALDYAEMCLTLTRLAYIDVFLLSTYTQLSMVHLALGNIEEAEGFARLSLEKNKEFNTGAMERAYGHIALADVLNVKGGYEAANRSLDSATSLTLSINDNYALYYIKTARA